MKSPIYVDDETTWPEVALRSFERSLPLLEEYEFERQRIDRLCEVDITARCNPPRIKEASGRLAIIAHADQELASRRLVGYHCSRLDAAEMQAIRENGLRPLSAALAYERIGKQAQLGNLPHDIAV